MVPVFGMSMRNAKWWIQRRDLEREPCHRAIAYSIARGKHTHTKREHFEIDSEDAPAAFTRRGTYQQHHIHMYKSPFISTIWSGDHVYFTVQFMFKCRGLSHFNCLSERSLSCGCGWVTAWPLSASSSNCRGDCRRIELPALGRMHRIRNTFCEREKKSIFFTLLLFAINGDKMKIKKIEIHLNRNYGEWFGCIFTSLFLFKMKMRGD